MSIHRSFAAGMMLAVASTLAGAQGKEAPAIGFDAGFSVASSPSLTTIAIPTQSVRLTLPMANGMAIEPSAAINYFSANGNSATTYMLGVSLLDYLSGDASTPHRVHVRPFLGVAGVSGSGFSTSNGLIGAGFGIETRVDPRLAVRWEAAYSHVFSTEGTNTITGTVGLTFRLK